MNYHCKDLTLVHADNFLNIGIVISNLEKRRRFTVGIKVSNEYPLGRVRFGSLDVMIGEVDEREVKKAILEGEQKEAFRLVAICQNLRAL